MDKNEESSYKLMHQEIAYKNVERSNNYKVGVADKFLINKVVDKVFLKFKKNMGRPPMGDSSAHFMLKKYLELYKIRYKINAPLF